MGSIRIALHVIPIYESSHKQTPESNASTERLNNISNRIINSLTPNPNWTGLWMLHQNLIGPYAFGKRKEFYPAVLFVAYVYEMSTDS